MSKQKPRSDQETWPDWTDWSSRGVEVITPKNSTQQNSLVEMSRIFWSDRGFTNKHNKKSSYICNFVPLIISILVWSRALCAVLLICILPRQLLAASNRWSGKNSWIRWRTSRVPFVSFSSCHRSGVEMDTPVPGISSVLRCTDNTNWSTRHRRQHSLPSSTITKLRTCECICPLKHSMGSYFNVRLI